MSNEEFAAWIGRVETSEREIEPIQAAMLAALLDYEHPPSKGDVLPPLWHWLDAMPPRRQSLIGWDGHPRRDESGFLPPIPLKRRMWAGSRVRFFHALRLGVPIRRMSLIRDISFKQGKSGSLAFVSVEHELSNPDGIILVEEQDIVYRDAGRSDETLTASSVPYDGPQPDWQQTFIPDPLLLFRHSAALFNGHRIHYDRDYAKREEGYPGLVVQGPLTATLCLEALMKRCPGKVTAFEFRGIRPLFDGNAATICGCAGEDNHELWVLNNLGEIAMRARATIATE